MGGKPSSGTLRPVQRMRFRIGSREPPHPWSKPRTEFYEAFDDPVPQLRGYAASLSGVDRALRLLLDKLDEHDLASDTVIVYMADNGFSCGHHGIWGKEMAPIR